MRRIGYWLRSQTQYALQSPYLYHLYGDVLYARLSRPMVQRLGLARMPPHRRQYYEELYKLVNRFQPREVLLHHTEDATACRCIVLAAPQAATGSSLHGYASAEFVSPEGVNVALIQQPHRGTRHAARWRSLQQEDDYRVSIDLYDVGILIGNPHLSPQHLILKGWGW